MTTEASIAESASLNMNETSQPREPINYLAKSGNKQILSGIEVEPVVAMSGSNGSVKEGDSFSKSPLPGDEVSRQIEEEMPMLQHNEEHAPGDKQHEVVVVKEPATKDDEVPEHEVLKSQSGESEVNDFEKRKEDGEENIIDRPEEIKIVEDNLDPKKEYSTNSYDPELGKSDSGVETISKPSDIQNGQEATDLVEQETRPVEEEKMKESADLEPQLANVNRHQDVETEVDAAQTDGTTEQNAEEISDPNETHENEKQEPAPAVEVTGPKSSIRNDEDRKINGVSEADASTEAAIQTEDVRTESLRENDKDAEKGLDSVDSSIQKDNSESLQQGYLQQGPPQDIHIDEVTPKSEEMPNEEDNVAQPIQEVKGLEEIEKAETLDNIDPEASKDNESSSAIVVTAADKDSQLMNVQDENITPEKPEELEHEAGDIQNVEENVEKIDDESIGVIDWSVAEKVVPEKVYSTVGVQEDAAEPITAEENDNKEVSLQSTKDELTSTSRLDDEVEQPKTEDSSIDEVQLTQPAGEVLETTVNDDKENKGSEIVPEGDAPAGLQKQEMQVNETIQKADDHDRESIKLEEQAVSEKESNAILDENSSSEPQSTQKILDKEEHDDINSKSASVTGTNESNLSASKPEYEEPKESSIPSKDIDVMREDASELNEKKDHEVLATEPEPTTSEVEKKFDDSVAEVATKSLESEESLTDTKDKSESVSVLNTESDISAPIDAIVVKTDKISKMPENAGDSLHGVESISEEPIVSPVHQEESEERIEASLEEDSTAEAIVDNVAESDNQNQKNTETKSRALLQDEVKVSPVEQKEFDKKLEASLEEDSTVENATADNIAEADNQDQSATETEDHVLLQEESKISLLEEEESNKKIEASVDEDSTVEDATVDNVSEVADQNQKTTETEDHVLLQDAAKVALVEQEESDKKLQASLEEDSTVENATVGNVGEADNQDQKATDTEDHVLLQEEPIVSPIEQEENDKKIERSLEDDPTVESATMDNVQEADSQYHKATEVEIHELPQEENSQFTGEVVTRDESDKTTLEAATSKAEENRSEVQNDNSALEHSSQQDREVQETEETMETQLDSEESRKEIDNADEINKTVAKTAVLTEEQRSDVWDESSKISEQNPKEHQEQQEETEEKMREKLDIKEAQEDETIKTVVSTEEVKESVLASAEPVSSEAQEAEPHTSTEPIEEKDEIVSESGVEESKETIEEKIVNESNSDDIKTDEEETDNAACVEEGTGNETAILEQQNSESASEVQQSDQSKETVVETGRDAIEEPREDQNEMEEKIESKYNPEEVKTADETDKAVTLTEEKDSEFEQDGGDEIIEDAKEVGNDSEEPPTISAKNDIVDEVHESVPESMESNEQTGALSSEVTGVPQDTKRSAEEGEELKEEITVKEDDTMATILADVATEIGSEESKVDDKHLQVSDTPVEAEEYKQHDVIGTKEPEESSPILASDNAVDESATPKDSGSVEEETKEISTEVMKDDKEVVESVDKPVSVSTDEAVEKVEDPEEKIIKEMECSETKTETGLEEAQVDPGIVSTDHKQDLVGLEADKPENEEIVESSSKLKEIETASDAHPNETNETEDKIESIVDGEEARITNETEKAVVSSSTEEDHKEVDKASVDEIVEHSKDLDNDTGVHTISTRDIPVDENSFDEVKESIPEATGPMEQTAIADSDVQELSKAQSQLDDKPVQTPDIVSQGNNSQTETHSEEQDSQTPETTGAGKAKETELASCEAVYESKDLPTEEIQADEFKEAHRESESSSTEIIAGNGIKDVQTVEAVAPPTTLPPPEEEEIESELTNEKEANFDTEEGIITTETEKVSDTPFEAEEYKQRDEVEINEPEESSSIMASDNAVDESATPKDYGSVEEETKEISTEVMKDDKEVVESVDKPVSVSTDEAVEKVEDPEEEIIKEMECSDTKTETGLEEAQVDPGIVSTHHKQDLVGLEADKPENEEIVESSSKLKEIETASDAHPNETNETEDKIESIVTNEIEKAVVSSSTEEDHKEVDKASVDEIVEHPKDLDNDTGVHTISTRDIPVDENSFDEVKESIPEATGPMEQTAIADSDVQELSKAQPQLDDKPVQTPDIVSRGNNSQTETHSEEQDSQTPETTGVVKAKETELASCEVVNKSKDLPTEEIQADEFKEAHRESESSSTEIIAGNGIKDVQTVEAVAPPTTLPLPKEEEIESELTNEKEANFDTEEGIITTETEKVSDTPFEAEEYKQRDEVEINEPEESSSIMASDNAVDESRPPEYSGSVEETKEISTEVMKDDKEVVESVDKPVSVSTDEAIEKVEDPEEETIKEMGYSETKTETGLEEAQVDPGIVSTHHKQDLVGLEADKPENEEIVESSSKLKEIETASDAHPNETNEMEEKIESIVDGEEARSTNETEEAVTSTEVEHKEVEKVSADEIIEQPKEADSDKRVETMSTRDIPADENSFEEVKESIPEATLSIEQTAVVDLDIQKVSKEESQLDEKPEQTASIFSQESDLQPDAHSSEERESQTPETIAAVKAEETELASHEVVNESKDLPAEEIQADETKEAYEDSESSSVEVVPGNEIKDDRAIEAAVPPTTLPYKEEETESNLANEKESNFDAEEAKSTIEIIEEQKEVEKAEEHGVFEKVKEVGEHMETTNSEVREEPQETSTEVMEEAEVEEEIKETEETGSDEKKGTIAEEAVTETGLEERHSGDKFVQVSDSISEPVEVEGNEQPEEVEKKEPKESSPDSVLEIPTDAISNTAEGGGTRENADRAVSSSDKDRALPITLPTQEDENEAKLSTEKTQESNSIPEEADTKVETEKAVAVPEEKHKEVENGEIIEETKHVDEETGPVDNESEEVQNMEKEETHSDEKKEAIIGEATSETSLEEAHLDDKPAQVPGMISEPVEAEANELIDKVEAKELKETSLDAAWELVANANGSATEESEAREDTGTIQEATREISEQDKVVDVNLVGLSTTEPIEKLEATKDIIEETEAISDETKTTIVAEATDKQQQEETAEISSDLVSQPDINVHADAPKESETTLETGATEVIESQEQEAEQANKEKMERKIDTEEDNSTNTIEKSVTSTEEENKEAEKAENDVEEVDTASTRDVIVDEVNIPIPKPVETDEVGSAAEEVPQQTLTEVMADEGKVEKETIEKEESSINEEKTIAMPEAGLEEAPLDDKSVQVSDVISQEHYPLPDVTKENGNATERETVKNEVTTEEEKLEKSAAVMEEEQEVDESSDKPLGVIAIGPVEKAEEIKDIIKEKDTVSDEAKTTFMVEAMMETGLEEACLDSEHVSESSGIGTGPGDQEVERYGEVQPEKEGRVEKDYDIEEAKSTNVGEKAVILTEEKSKEAAKDSNDEIIESNNEVEKSTEEPPAITNRDDAVDEVKEVIPIAADVDQQTEVVKSDVQEVLLAENKQHDTVESKEHEGSYNESGVSETPENVGPVELEGTKLASEAIYESRDLTSEELLADETKELKESESLITDAVPADQITDDQIIQAAGSIEEDRTLPAEAPSKEVDNETKLEIDSTEENVKEVVAIKGERPEDNKTEIISESIGENRKEVELKEDEPKTGEEVSLVKEEPRELEVHQQELGLSKDIEEKPKEVVHEGEGGAPYSTKVETEEPLETALNSDVEITKTETVAAPEFAPEVEKEASETVSEVCSLEVPTESEISKTDFVSAPEVALKANKEAPEPVTEVHDLEVSTESKLSTTEDIAVPEMALETNKEAPEPVVQVRALEVPTESVATETEIKHEHSSTLKVEEYQTEKTQTVGNEEENTPSLEQVYSAIATIQEKPEETGSEIGRDVTLAAKTQQHRSLLDMMQKSTTEREMVKQLAQLPEEAQEDGEEHSGSDGPVMVEESSYKEVEFKTGPQHHHKKHNILSEVGSKVKHSISKVRKVITGKASSPKYINP